MYIAKFGFRHTATDAADTAVFAMRVPAASLVRAVVKKVKINVACDVTTAVASRIGYGLSRFNAADPTGGSSPPRIGLSSRDTVSVIADANIKTGAALTLGGVFEGNFHEVFIATSNGAAAEQVIHFEDVSSRCEGLNLFPGEGLTIRTAIVAVVGQMCSGSVFWEEVT
jgi:hypothetical protein